MPVSLRRGTTMDREGRRRLVGACGLGFLRRYGPVPRALLPIASASALAGSTPPRERMQTPLWRPSRGGSPF